jgi:tetratricopeptide (TPR) repeat protein
VNSAPKRTGSRALLADCHLALGERTEDGDAARRDFDLALAEFQALLGAEPGSVAYRKGLAAVHSGLGRIPYYRKDYPGAASEFSKAVSIRESILGERPDDRENRLVLAHTLVNLSMCYQLTGPWDQATGFHDRAEAALTLLVRDDPLDTDSLRGLAQLRLNWGDGLVFLGKPGSALAEVDKNIRPLEEALGHEPNLVAIRQALADSYGLRAKALDALHRPADALPDWERLIALDRPEKRFEHRATLVLLLRDAGDYPRALSETEGLAAVVTRETPDVMVLLLARYAASCLGRLDRDDPRAGPFAAVTLRLLAEVRARDGPDGWTRRARELNAEGDWKPLHERPEFKTFLSE